MNKNDLVECLKSDYPKLSKEAIKAEIDHLFSILSTELAQNSTITLSELGIFKTRVKLGERKYIPASGTYKEIPPRKIVSFKPYKTMTGNIT